MITRILLVFAVLSSMALEACGQGTGNLPLNSSPPQDTVANKNYSLRLYRMTGFIADSSYPQQNILAGFAIDESLSLTATARDSILLFFADDSYCEPDSLQTLCGFYPQFALQFTTADGANHTYLFSTQCPQIRRIDTVGTKHCMVDETAAIWLFQLLESQSPMPATPKVKSKPKSQLPKSPVMADTKLEVEQYLLLKAADDKVRKLDFSEFIYETGLYPNIELPRGK